MSQQEKIKFVVKNGRYSGSIVDLDQDQEYSLGRSFHCDIAIDEPHFAERQMLLKVSPDGVQIKLLAEGKLSVNGTAKDTASQSEWRGMDPHSSFVMNDLEFSFEVPASFSMNSKSEVADASVTAASHSKVNKNAQNNAKSPKVNAETVLEGQNFHELETQVPDDHVEFQTNPNDHSEDGEVDIQVVPNLADKFGVRPGSASPSPQKRKNSNKGYIIVAFITVGLLVFIAICFYFALDPARHFITQLTDTSGSNTTDQQQNTVDTLDETITDIPDNGFSPFMAQNDEQHRFIDQKLEDPFLAYDQMNEKNQSFGRLDGKQYTQTNEAPSLEKTRFNNQQENIQPNRAQLKTIGEETAQFLAVMNGGASPTTIVMPAAKNLLSGLGLGFLEVTTRKPEGDDIAPVVVVSGFIDNRDIWIRAKAILRQDIQEIGSLIDNVSSPEIRKAQLDRWINESNIKGKVQTYLSERGLVAKVNLNPSQVPTWRAISNQYVKKFENNPPLFIMKDPGDWLKIRSISFGERPYLVTQEGAVLMPGSKLDNGYSIVAIRKSGIELRDQFGSYTYVF